MRAARCTLFVLAAAATLCACRGERPAPPPESAPAPAATLRPLTSRDNSPAPAVSPHALPPGHPPLDGAGPAEAVARRSESVAGTIVVAPALRERASGGVLFVIARSAAGRQIVAVRREDGATFPFAFRISAADAMVAGTRFEGPIEITARLSTSGDAVAAKGDLEGTAKGVAVGAKDVKIALDSVRQ